MDEMTDDESFNLAYYEDSLYYGNISNYEREPLEINMPWTWNFTIIVIMAVFGIAANSALLAVTALNRHLRTVSNILVANLAVADLIMFIFGVPSDILHWLVFHWPDTGLGNFLCKLSGGSWSLAQALCVASLTAVSIERFCSLRWKIHAKRTALILVLVWLFSIVCSVPVLVWARVVNYYGMVSICHILPGHSWNNPTAKGFITAGFVLKYAIPLILITFCYCGMAAILLSARGATSSSATLRASRRLAIVVLVLNVSFAICWLPSHAITLFFLYASLDEILSVSFHVYMTLHEVGHVLVYVNSCLNPVVVFAISAAHRECLLRFPRSLLLYARRAPVSAEAGDGTQHNPDDRYARLPDDVFVSETECVEEKT